MRASSFAVTSAIPTSRRDLAPQPLEILHGFVVEGEDIDGVLDRDGADALEATPVSSPKHAGKGSRTRLAAAG